MLFGAKCTFTLWLAFVRKLACATKFYNMHALSRCMKETSYLYGILWFMYGVRGHGNIAQLEAVLR